MIYHPINLSCLKTWRFEIFNPSLFKNTTTIGIVFTFRDTDVEHRYIKLFTRPFLADPMWHSIFLFEFKTHLARLTKIEI